MSRTSDVAVVGGGVVGLAMAREVLLREPRAKVVVFEQESRLGAHASGRNSGVLHAGFYYAPDSLKAGLTGGQPGVGGDVATQLRAHVVAAVVQDDAVGLNVEAAVGVAGNPGG